jgi:hypothetical protein
MQKLVVADAVIVGQLVEELPSVGSIELAHFDRGNELRSKVTQVNAVLRACLGIQRFPVRDTSAGSATDRPKCLITLDIFDGVFGMTFDLDCAEFEVDPWPSDPTTKRAVAGSRHLGRGREREFDSSAVAGASMHGKDSLKDADRRGGCDFGPND